MRWRSVFVAAVVAAVPAIAIMDAPAEAQALPACPSYSALAFDWPSGVYTQIAGLPLGCFPIVCPAGYDGASPYADGRNPLTVIGPYSGLAVQPSPQSLPNGFIPPGCTLSSGSIIPGPPFTVVVTTPGTTATTVTGATPASVPTVVLDTPVILAQPPTGQAVTTVFAGAPTRQAASNLPRTGQDPRPVTQVALLLVAGGLALLVGSRKRSGYTPKFAAGR